MFESSSIYKLCNLSQVGMGLNVIIPFSIIVSFLSLHDVPKKVFLVNLSGGARLFPGPPSTAVNLSRDKIFSSIVTEICIYFSILD